MTAWFFYWVAVVGFGATASFWYWALVIGLIATTVVTRLRVARQEANAKNGEEPVGLGGWLVFFLLYLLFYLFFFARRAIEDLGSQTGGVDLRPEPEWLIYDLALFALLAATTVALLRKQPAFRWLWKTQAVIFFCFHAVGIIGGLVSATPLIAAAGPITAAILLAMSWWYVNVSRRVRSIFGGARLTVTPAIPKQERFLKGFAVGFLVFGAGAAAYGLHRGYVVNISGIAGCSLLGLLVGAGAILWERYYPAKLRR